MKKSHPPVVTGRRRELDRLESKHGLTIRPARADEIPSLMALARRQLSLIATVDDVAVRVHLRNPSSFLVVDDRTGPVGVVALLLLNGQGLDALLTGELCFTNPDLRHLAPWDEVPAGIYVWTLCAQGRAISALTKIMEWSKQDGRARANLYARPVTAEGERFMRHGGFCPIRCGQSDLWRYQRVAAEESPTIVAA